MTLLCSVSGFATTMLATAAEPIQVEAISTGLERTCAIETSGQVVCWGSSQAEAAPDNLNPVPISGLSDAKAISVGWAHTCAIRDSGQAVCWGGNHLGELGDGTTESRLAPTPVSGLNDAVAISVGAFDESCAIRSTGQAVCWGSNWLGQLGDGTTEDRLTPTPVSGLTDAVAISTGYTSCAIRASGQEVCWGMWKGLTPTNVTEITDAKAISGSCAVRASGETLCWGEPPVGATPLPVPVNGLTDAVAISADYTGCAIRASGQAVCWGPNHFGQIGDGTTEDRSTPIPVSGLSNAVQISAGTGYACAINADEHALCWGNNQNGQLGDGTTENRLTPTLVVEGDPQATPFETCATNPALCPTEKPAPAVSLKPEGQSNHRQCLAKANAAFKKAMKTANRKHGNARSRAIRTATKKKKKRVAACK